MKVQKVEICKNWKQQQKLKMQKLKTNCNCTSGVWVALATVVATPVVRWRVASGQHSRLFLQRGQLASAMCGCGVGGRHHCCYHTTATIVAASGLPRACCCHASRALASGVRGGPRDSGRTQSPLSLRCEPWAAGRRSPLFSRALAVGVAM